VKVAILAGGLGSRIQEETEIKPKPMVEIGGRPILWHIMKIYAHQGFTEFAIALGYKGEVIKRYMLEYASLHSDLRVDPSNGIVTSRNGTAEDWTVDLIDTGHDTATGGRIKRLAP
jgi:glucose-1-phosphate cytidylyltransferase